MKPEHVSLFHPVRRAYIAVGRSTALPLSTRDNGLLALFKVEHRTGGSIQLGTTTIIPQFTSRHGSITDHAGIDSTALRAGMALTTS
jgi:hypothetical protein